MATKQASKLPNGTSTKASDLKITVKPFTGELPKKSVGRERTPSPFDSHVKASMDSGQTLHAACPNDPEQRKVIVTELRRAAAFHKLGLDLWQLDDGIAFKARARRERKASESNGK